MTWLITGGSGQLGIALSHELRQRGILFKSWSSQDLDVTQAPNVQSRIANVAPNVIINCAAWTNVDGAESDQQAASLVNCFGAENVALAAKENGARLIHISTDYVFSGDSDNPWKELDETKPQSTYGRSKAEGERRVQAIYSDNSFIVRTAWLYSPWRKNFAKAMIQMGLIGEGEVRIVNDEVGQPTSAMDLAKQLVDLGLSNSPTGIYHGTNAGQATRIEFAQEIFKLIGADASRICPVSSRELKRLAKRPNYSVLGLDAWAETGIHSMRDWRIALAEAMPSMQLMASEE